MSHARRPEVDGRHPVHVTLRLVRGLPSLRSGRLWPVVEAALAAGGARFGMVVVHYSVQSNHLHLLVEVTDKVALSRGMQGLRFDSRGG